ncbi:DUF5959 family protein [Streptomyces sp. WM6372]|uniref:DUF5959 family protein n=1 Tax=Streptomyces sp. WM6372 TaxID=1415555 RepID=UPI003B637E4A
MSAGPSVLIQLSGERGGPEVVVEPSRKSMVTLRAPLVPPDDWIADHRQRLRQLTNRCVPMLSAQRDKPPPADSSSQGLPSGSDTAGQAPHRKDSALERKGEAPDS